VIAVRSDLKILIATQPVDFRKGIHGLVALVAEALKANPYCGDIFIFRSKRADRLKLIAWDGTGMVLVTKWLEEGRFVFPKIQDDAMVLTGPELSVLLAGLDWMNIDAKVVKRPLRTG
jgi:transposase